MKVYQLKLVRKNIFERRTDVITDLLFEHKRVAFESFLRSYLSFLEIPEYDETLISMTTYQDDEVWVREKGSYFWRIECVFCDTGDMTLDEDEASKEEVVYEFHFNPIELQKEIPSEFMCTTSMFHANSASASSDVQENKIKKQGHSNFKDINLVSEVDQSLALPDFNQNKSQEQVQLKGGYVNLFDDNLPF